MRDNSVVVKKTTLTETKDYQDHDKTKTFIKSRQRQRLSGLESKALVLSLVSIYSSPCFNQSLVLVYSCFSLVLRPCLRDSSINVSM